MVKKALYKRILLKVSGEAVSSHQKSAIDPQAVLALAKQITEIRDLDVQVGIVIGGGNIIRGSQTAPFNMPREKADQMGMLATTLNGMMLVQALESLGCPAIVVGAFECGNFIPQVGGEEVVELLENGVIVVFVGGTGLPYFTTDTAAALRACEIKADLLIKATKVDGIFEKDPAKHPKAKKIPRVTYNTFLAEQLHVMDGTAVALCRDNNIPIQVLNIFKKGALKLAVQNKAEGSVVTRE